MALVGEEMRNLSTVTYSTISYRLHRICALTQSRVSLTRGVRISNGVLVLIFIVYDCASAS